MTDANHASEGSTEIEKTTSKVPCPAQLFLIVIRGGVWLILKRGHP